MYNDEYDDEQVEQNNGGFITNFYYNNKVLVWIFLGIILFIILMSILTSGGSNNTKVDDKVEVVLIPEEEVVISIGNSKNFIATVKNNPAAQFTWSSSDETIARVDNGNVVGVSYGKTQITATYIHTDNEKYSATRDVIIADGDPNVRLTDVSFKSGDLFMPVNSTYAIKLALTPSNAYVENKEFISSNTSVVTVDNSGVVTSIGEGEATITFSVNNSAFRKELRVYVSRDYNRNEIIVTPEKISFDGEIRKIKVGSTEKLTYMIVPENADHDKLTWKSSDESILTVENGRIKGIKEGTATITLASVNGTNDKIDIEVESDIVDVSDINLSVSDIYLSVGQNQTITPIVSPDNASNKSLSYSSSDSSIAIVSPNETGTQATITGIGAGSSSIVVRSTNNIEKRVNVIVTGSSSESSGGSSSGSSGGGSTSGDATIVVRSASNNLSKTYEGVKNIYAKGPSTVTVTIHSGVSKIRYCLVPRISPDCEPNIDMNGTGNIVVPDGNIYMLCIKKYDNNGNEIGSSSENYSNGILHYYINTKGNGASGDSSSGGSSSGTLYTVSGLYDSETIARSHPVSSGARVTFNVNNSVGHIVVCHGITSNCTPATTITSTQTFTITSTGVTTFNIKEVRNGSTTTVKKYIYVQGSSSGTSPSGVCCCTSTYSSCNWLSSETACTSSSMPIKINGANASNCSGNAKKTPTQTPTQTLTPQKKCSAGQYLEGSICKSCPKCNGSITCFTSPEGSTSSSQCTGTIPAGKYIECNSSGCTVSSCTGNTYSTSRSVKYSSSLKTSCTSCGNKTANSSHTGCDTSTPTKSLKNLSTLSISCSGTIVVIKDGSKVLDYKKYCDKPIMKPGTISTRYTYTCRGDNVEYEGIIVKTCPES